MLILTRRTGDSLVIGDEVCVKVLGVKGGQVRLGIEAPRDIAIHRQELAQGHADATKPDKQARLPADEHDETSSGT